MILFLDLGHHLIEGTPRLGGSAVRLEQLPQPSMAIPHNPGLVA
jgi:hypothetical protein